MKKVRALLLTINFFIIFLTFTSVFAEVATAEQQNSRYLVNLGENWPDVKGYNFSFSIPNGYKVSNVTYYNRMTIFNLTGPPIIEVLDSERFEDEPADHLSIDISLWTFEGNFSFEWLTKPSCSGPLFSLSNMSIKKTSGYENYYLKNIGCYYCADPRIEMWGFESSISGVIFLNESLKSPALMYSIGYRGAYSCDLGEAGSYQYFMIGDTPMNKKKSEVVNHIFSSIQITPSKERIPITEIIIITSAAAGTIALIGVLSTEWGKNKFYWFLMLLGPLYIRTVKEEVFDNQKRLCMYNHIAENQPVVYSEIKKICNLSDGEINWHAHMMIQFDLIKTQRKGFHLFFYLAKSPRLSPDNFIKLTDLQKSIFNLIIEKPGITQAEIVEKIGLKQQNISYNLLKLEEKGKIKVEKKEKIKVYYPLKKNSSSN